MSIKGNQPRASYHLQGEILQRLTALERRVDEMEKEEINLAATLAETWEHVRQRDWQKYPLDGMTK